MNDDIRQLIDTLLKIEALHAGATTPGERDAAGAAIERIKKKLNQFKASDPVQEVQCTFSNHWSKQLFCALAKRYDLQPYRYYRQRRTTVMLQVPRRFLDEVLWPEFQGVDEVLHKYLDEMTSKIISEAIFQGSAEEELREQPLLIGDAHVALSPSARPVLTPPTTTRPTSQQSSSTQQQTASHGKSATSHSATQTKTAPIAPPVTVSRSTASFPSGTKVGRNDPCPCGSGKKFKKCCQGRIR